MSVGSPQFAGGALFFTCLTDSPDSQPVRARAAPEGVMTMNKVIAVLALAFAAPVLVGCGSLPSQTQRTSPPAPAVQLPSPPVAQAPVSVSENRPVAVTPVPSRVPAVAPPELTNLSHPEFKWKNPGADPYATSREAAMRMRESAFRKLGFSDKVVKLLVEETKKPGARVKLPMGTRLSAMLSKGGNIHRNTVIDWKAPMQGTELVAPAEKWQVEVEGIIYTVYLFDVCNNWSDIVVAAPSPIPTEPPSSKQTLGPPVPLGSCKGWSVTANAWSERMVRAISPDLADKIRAAIVSANDRESEEATRLDVYQTDALSRTVGKPLREIIKTRAPVTAEIKVRRVNVDSTTKRAVSVQEFGVLHMVNGEGTFELQEDPRNFIVELGFPMTPFRSPVQSGGERRLRIFPYEWTRCGVNAHGATD